jgi:hypothetical protein
LGRLLRDRGAPDIDFAGWTRIDLAEREAGARADRPRVKRTDTAVMAQHARG